jgi:ATP-binding cassette subfamily F protein uup
MSRSLLLGCDGVGKAYGARTLFTGLSLGLLDGDQVGLVGPNGSGKSTLLKVLAGIELPDHGTRSVRGGVRVGYVPQDPVFPAGGTVEDVMVAAVAGVDEDDRPARVARTLGRAGFTDGGAALDTLSGGWRKRLAIARELAGEPDVLLMDEPTNHLDIDGILWLEGVLRERARAVLVVSHDRYFLEHVATRMMELGAGYPNGLFEADGGYSEFLVRREEYLRGQAAYEEALANTVRREIEWLRRGAKARSTKAKGRILEAHRLIEELGDVRARATGAPAGIEMEASGRRTQKLLVTRGLTKSLGGRSLVRGLDLAITRKTHVGLIGPNGSGKTTLLNLLAGSLAPDTGGIERADGLRLVRFEQHRASLDPQQSLRRALAPEGDTLVFQGRRVHVAAWAKRFLFRPEQLELPVGRLSGGEQARILVARLMGEPADLLVLDEPTNDLDITTLQILEDSLAEFEGGLVLVTHDRFMLERVSTTILALDGKGGAIAFADYAQWEQWVEESRSTQDGSARGDRTLEPHGTPATPPHRANLRPRRLGYLEQREWEAIEQAILDAEAVVVTRRKLAEDPAIASNAAALESEHAALLAAQAEVDRLYARWAELEAKRSEDPATAASS